MLSTISTSLVDSIEEDNTDLTQPAAEEGKAVTEGDLAVTRLTTRQPSRQILEETSKDASHSFLQIFSRADLMNS